MRKSPRYNQGRKTYDTLTPGDITHFIDLMEDLLLDPRRPTYSQIKVIVMHQLGITYEESKRLVDDFFYDYLGVPDEIPLDNPLRLWYTGFSAGGRWHSYY